MYGLQASTSIGRAAVSKTAGWGFETLLACHYYLEDLRAGMADKIKWAVAVLALLGGLGGFYYFAEHSLLMRVPALLVVVGICVTIVLQTAAGGQLVGFFREANIEVRKVVWPTGKETTQTTLVVMGMVVVVAVFLWLLDMFLLWSVKLLMGQGG